MPFYSLPTLFEQSINHYFRSCTFSYWELYLIVFSWEPFCLVPFHAVPNNRTAILVCPFWKAVDFFVNKLWRRYGCIQTTDFNFWINSNSKMAFVLNFHFDWCLFMLCNLMHCHFSMSFFESCWCFWQPTLMTTVRILLYPLQW